MTVENTNDTAVLEINTDTDIATTELKPTFKALPEFLLATEDDELQPEYNNTPRPKQSA